MPYTWKFSLNIKFAEPSYLCIGHTFIQLFWSISYVPRCELCTLQQLTVRVETLKLHKLEVL